MPVQHDDLRMISLGISSAAPGLPVGVHLRWSFNPSNRELHSAVAGFLTPGFKVYRRPTEQGGGGTLVTVQLSTEGTVPSTTDPEIAYLAPSGLTYHFATAAVAIPLPAALSSVVDSYPAVFNVDLPALAFELQVLFSVGDPSGYLKLDGLDQGVIAGTVQHNGTATNQVIAVKVDRMDGLRLEHQFGTIQEIRYRLVETAINLAQWTQIAGPLTPSSDWTVVSARLLPIDITRLGGPGVEGWDTLAQVVTELWGSGGGQYAWDPASDPLPSGTTLTIKPAHTLHLTALEPGNARAIGLLHIDTTAVSGTSYDYLLEGAYSDAAYYWICYGVSTNTSRPLPAPFGLAGSASNGPRWVHPTTGMGYGGGRVKLTWNPPQTNVGTLAAYGPARYVVETQPLGTGTTPDPIDPMAWVSLATGSHSVLTPDSGDWSATSCAHGHLGRGWYGYRIQGIDIFGRGTTMVGPITVEVPPDPAPPPPPVVVARYLDSSVTDLTVDESAWVATNTSGVRVRWTWSREASIQAPQVAEFRVYFRVNDQDRRTAQVTAVTVNGDGTATLDTDMNLVTNPGDLTGGHVVIEGVRHRIVSHTSTAASQFSITQATWVDPSTGANVAREPTVGTAAFLEDVRAPTAWDDRIFAQAHDIPPMTTTVSSVSSSTDGLVLVTCSAVSFGGFAHAGPGILYDDTTGERYAAWSHTVDGGGNLTQVTIRVETDGSGTPTSQPSSGDSLVYYPGYEVWIPGVSLAPGASSGVDVGFVSVSSSDSDSTVLDDPKWSSGSWGGRGGNEGSVARRSGIFAVWSTAPAAPTVGSQPGVLATQPDFHGISRFTLQWTVSSGLVYHLLRATAESLVDAYIRDSAPTTTPDDYDDTDVLTWAAPSAGYDDLFTPVNEEPIGSAYFTGTMATWVDELPGRGNNRYVYRLIAEDAAGNRSDPSLFPDVVYLPISPPRAPQVVRCLGGDGTVTLSWRRVREARYLQDDGSGGTTASSFRPELTGYRIYRTTDPDAAQDPRLMTLLATEAPTLHAVTESYEDSAVQAGTTYYYRVSAVVERSAAGTEEQESPPSAGTSAKPYSISLPEEPTWTTSAYNGTSGGVELEWSATDPQLTCKLERSSGALEGFWLNRSGWLDEGVYAYTDTDVESGVTYTYRLRVRNLVGFERIAGTTASETIP